MKYFLGILISSKHEIHYNYKSLSFAPAKVCFCVPVNYNLSYL